jgi:hypothetical protein
MGRYDPIISVLWQLASQESYQDSVAFSTATPEPNALFIPAWFGLSQSRVETSQRLVRH